MQTYHDNYINEWADVFVAEELHRYVTLEQFLAAPDKTRERIESGRYRPLLAEQRELADRVLDAERLVDRADRQGLDTDRLIDRAARGMTTAADAEALERLVACARGIVDVPRRDGRPVEKLRHHCWPKRTSAAHFRARGEV